MEGPDQRALKFVEQWIVANVEDDAAPVTSVDDPRPADLAVRCAAGALAAGATGAEIEVRYSRLAKRMAETLTAEGPEV